MTSRTVVLLLASITALTLCTCCRAGDQVDVTIQAVEEPDPNSADAVAAAKARGVAAAQRDLGRGIFRMRDYGEPIPPDFKRIDPPTGYQIERIPNCEPHPTKAFLAEIKAYNQVMQAWYDKHK